MENIPKWKVTFEKHDPNKTISKKTVTEILYDLKSLNPDIDKVTISSSRALKSLIRGSLLVGVDYKRYDTAGKISSPKKLPEDGKFYLIWAGIEPSNLEGFGIKTQAGDAVYDVMVLAWRKQKGEYHFLAISADEPNLENTKTHIKDIIRLVLDEPKKVKYVRMIKILQGPPK
ncbi:MAG: hypothetical protein ABIF92_00725 [archaeon]